MRRLLSLSLGISLALASTSQTAIAQNGACCLSVGSCLDTNQAGCNIGSGDYLGDGTTCATTVCMGACCFGDNTCVEDSLDGCDGSGGTFQGPNTTCELHCAAKLPTVFTYQGQLKLAGVPLNGTADLEFSLWTSTKGGDPVGSIVLKQNISVANGLLSVPLDFGVSVFNGNARWLEIAVRSPHDVTDTELFTTLDPRQLITATPYALQTRGLFVSDVGNVGIGTATPSQKLDVRSDDDDVRGALILNDNTGANAASRLWLSTDGGGDAYTIFRIPGPKYWAIGEDNDDGGSFKISASTVLNSGERLTVTRAGNVGIGTTTPRQKLEVVKSSNGAAVHASNQRGTIRVVVAGDETTGVFGSCSSDTSEPKKGIFGFAAGSAGTKYGVFGEAFGSGTNWAGYFRGDVHVTNKLGINDLTPDVALDVIGSINYTGTISDVSDERLKENIAPVRDGLSKLLELNGVYFNMKDVPDVREVGLIAQNVQKVLPEAVSVVDKEHGYLGVSYPSLIPLIIEAVKEQESEIRELRAEKDSQQAQIAALRAELSEMKESIRKMTPSTRASALGMASPLLAAACLIGMVVMGRGRKGGAK